MKKSPALLKFYWLQRSVSLVKRKKLARKCCISTFFNVFNRKIAEHIYSITLWCTKLLAIWQLCTQTNALIYLLVACLARIRIAQLHVPPLPTELYQAERDTCGTLPQARQVWLVWLVSCDQPMLPYKGRHQCHPRQDISPPSETPAPPPGAKLHYIDRGCKCTSRKRKNCWFG